MLCLGLRGIRPNHGIQHMVHVACKHFQQALIARCLHAAGPGFIILLAGLILPESPSSLAERGQVEKARHVSAPHFLCLCADQASPCSHFNCHILGSARQGLMNAWSVPSWVLKRESSTALSSLFMTRLQLQSTLSSELGLVGRECAALLVSGGMLSCLSILNCSTSTRRKYFCPRVPSQLG